MQGRDKEYEGALAPRNALMLRLSGYSAASIGHFDAALAALRRAVVLDPLDRRGYSALAHDSMPRGDMENQQRPMQQS